ncbi:MAG: hypothetical protein ROO71_10595 [Balneola sp.]
MNNRLLLLTSLIFLTSSVTYGQRISADRPGAGFGSYTVPVGKVYLESGASINKDFSDVGQLYLRTGVTENFEVQFNAGTVLLPNGGDAQVGSQAILLKYGLGTFSDDKLSLAISSRTNLPFLNSNDEYYFTRVNLIGDYSLNKTWSLNSNLGYGDFLDGFGNGSFNFNITPAVIINEKSDIYFGYAVLFDENFTSDLVEAGVDYFVNDSFKLDAGFVYSDGDDLFLTFGIAKRF